MHDCCCVQLVAAGEPGQMEMWQTQADEDQDSDDDEGAFTLAQFRAKCCSWWQPRRPQLAGVDGSAKFTVEVRWLLPGLQSMWDAPQHDRHIECASAAGGLFASAAGGLFALNAFLPQTALAGEARACRCCIRLL